MAINLQDLAQRLIRLEQTNRRRVALAAKLLPQNFSNWLNGTVEKALSYDKQQELLSVLGLRLTRDHFHRISLDLMPGRLLHWVVTLRPVDQPDVASLDDVRFVLEACRLELKYLKVFRYEGSPSFVSILMLPGEAAQTSAWIHLRLDSSAVEAETLDSETLGVTDVTNLPAGQWFEGLNGAQIDLARMDNAYQFPK